MNLQKVFVRDSNYLVHYTLLYIEGYTSRKSEKASFPGIGKQIGHEEIEGVNKLANKWEEIKVKCLQQRNLTVNNYTQSPLWTEVSGV